MMMQHFLYFECDKVELLKDYKMPISLLKMWCLFDQT